MGEYCLSVSFLHTFGGECRSNACGGLLLVRSVQVSSVSPFDGAGPDALDPVRLAQSLYFRMRFTQALGGLLRSCRTDQQECLVKVGEWVAWSQQNCFLMRS